MVTCAYCLQPIDGTKFKTHKKKRYHFECFDALQKSAEADEVGTKEKRSDKDLAALHEYICDLYGIKSIPYLVSKQISEYATQLGYSYSGIQKTLFYFYSLKENPVDTDTITIGIVPYIYEEALAFYKAVFDTSVQNEEFTIVETKRTIRIRPKERSIPCSTRIEDL